MASVRLPGDPKRRDEIKPRIEQLISEGRFQEVLDGLSEKQRRFCEQYLLDFNGSAAVLRAGYETQYPNRLASQMLKNPAIKLCIDQLTIERADKNTLKPEYVINKVTKTIERAEQDGNHSAVLRGCELLARHLGMFIERQEISGPNGDAIKIKRVQEAADAFTSAIAGLIDRRGAEEPFIVAE
jgi:phage terminase small subunit